MSIPPDPEDAARLELNPDEAVILFELLARWCDGDGGSTPSAQCFASAAEGAVLIGIKADLEKQLVAPFKSNYDQLVESARSRLAGMWDYPTLRG